MLKIEFVYYRHLEIISQTLRNNNKKKENVHVPLIQSSPTMSSRNNLFEM